MQAGGRVGGQHLAITITVAIANANANVIANGACRPLDAAQLVLTRRV